MTDIKCIQNTILHLQISSVSFSVNWYRNTSTKLARALFSCPEYLLRYENNRHRRRLGLTTRPNHAINFSIVISSLVWLHFSLERGSATRLYIFPRLSAGMSWFRVLIDRSWGCSSVSIPSTRARIPFSAGLTSDLSHWVLIDVDPWKNCT